MTQLTVQRTPLRAVRNLAIANPFKGNPVSPQSTIDRIRKTGMDALDRGKYREAMVAFESLMEITDDWTCRFWLATTYLGARMNHRASHHLLQITENCPDADLRSSAMNMLCMLDTAA